MSAAQPVIVMQGIVKRYSIGKPNELEILHGIDLQSREPGEFVAIVGGRRQRQIDEMMNILGALDRPTRKAATSCDGVDDPERPGDKELAKIRDPPDRLRLSRTFNLIGRMSALKNVELPMPYAGMPARERSQRAAELLDLVGMSERKKHQPNELSGGQKQRVAIARAMANDPSLILADEPTGALDTATSRVVMDLFHKLHEEQHKTIVLITHNPELAEETQRVITLRDGQIVNVRKGAGVHGRA